jgi:hypothetical protein
MKMHLVAASVLFLSVAYLNTAYAVDDDTIKFIHSKTKSEFFAMCKSKIPGATDSTCNCLAGNTVANINDDSLKKCSDNDSSCMSNIITTAGLSAFSQQGIATCMQQGQNGNAGGTAAPASASMQQSAQ